MGVEDRHYYGESGPEDKNKPLTFMQRLRKFLDRLRRKNEEDSKEAQEKVEAKRTVEVAREEMTIRQRLEASAKEKYNQQYEELKLQQKLELMAQEIPSENVESARRTRAQLDKVHQQTKEDKWKWEDRQRVRRLGQEVTQDIDPEKNYEPEFKAAYVRDRDPKPEELNKNSPFHRESEQQVQQKGYSLDQARQAEDDAMDVARELQEALFQEAQREAAKEHLARKVVAEQKLSTTNKDFEHYPDEKKNEEVIKYVASKKHEIDKEISAQKVYVEQGINDLNQKDLQGITRQFTKEVPHEVNFIASDLNVGENSPSPMGTMDWLDRVDDSILPAEAQKHIKWVKDHRDLDINNPAYQQEFQRRFEKALDKIGDDDPLRDQVLAWQGKYFEQTGNRTRQGELLPRDEAGWKEKAEELFDRIEKNRDDVRIDFNRTVSEVKEKIISNMRLSGDKDIRDAADELEVRLSTIVSAHNGFLAFDTIGFGQDSIRKLEELSKSTPTGSFFKEIGQDIAGVKHPIADSMQYIEVVIPQMIQDKHGEALGFADIGSDKLGFSKGNPLEIDKDTKEIIGGSLWNRLDAFLKEKFKDQLGADDQQEVRDRIIRRSIRFSMLTGRLPEIIARNSHIPHGPAQYQENPFRSVLQIFMPTVFGLNKWDQLSHHEKETIYAAWAGKMKGGSLEDRMRQGEININSFMPYSDAFSHGWRDRLYVKALDDKKYGGKWQEFGLWMRYFYEGDNKVGKSAMLDKILSRDTHILPLARLFLGDNELNQITGGKFEKFDRKISTALLTKLGIQMRTGKLDIADSDCATDYERNMLKVISQNKSTIDTVMGYLKTRKQQILDGAVVVNGKKMSLNHLQLKTLSVEDMPLEILHDDPELAAEQGLIGRLLTGETSLGYGIFQSWSELVTHPENLSLENLQKILDTGKQWYGQEGVSEKFVNLAVPALQNLYQARWYDRLPNWFYETFPSFPRPNEISEIRDFVESMHGEQWKYKIEELMKTGRLDRHIAEKAMKLVHATEMDLIPRKLGIILLGIILATAVLGVAQGMKELDGNGAPSGGGHH